MKKLLLILIITFAGFNYASACTDEQRMEMINAGISADYVKEKCEEENLDLSGDKEDSKKEPKESEQFEVKINEKKKELKNPQENSFTNSEENFNKSKNNNVFLSQGNVSGEFEGANGDTIDLDGSITQIGYKHIYNDGMLIGIKLVNIQMQGEYETYNYTYSYYSGYNYYYYTLDIQYELRGFAISLGQKIDTDQISLMPQITYMTGDASISAGGFKDLVTGTGDYLSLELPSMYNFESAAVGANIQLLFGGSTNENIEVRLSTAFSLQASVYF